MVNLLDIPPEVISGDIFPLLQHNDLLRMRRVCKSVNLLANDHLRLKGRLVNTEIQIGRKKNDPSRKGYSLSEFLSLEPCLPNITRFYFYIEDEVIYQDPELPEFFKRYGDKMTHLRLSRLFAPHLHIELEFLSNLPNLKSLTIEILDTAELAPGDLDTLPVSSVFWNLKELRVKKDISREVHQFNFFWSVVGDSPKLEIINHPDPIFMDLPQRGFLVYRLIHDLIQKRKEKLARSHSDVPKLMEFDLDTFHRYDPNDSAFFLELCRQCHLYNDKMRMINVNARLLQDFHLFEQPIPPEAVQSLVVSVKDIHQKLFELELPLLESIVVGERSKHVILVNEDDVTVPPRETVRVEWPNLQKIDYLVANNEKEFGPTFRHSAFLDFLFVDRQRPKLTTLALRYTKSVLSSGLRDGRCPPVPRVRNIMTCCPNISTLTLLRWPGTNKALSQLWTGLPFLEDVTLNDMPALGNVAFVGEDVENPTFLQLKNMKRLRIYNMSHMAKLTDTVFKIVFRHLPLLEFDMRTSDLHQTSNKISLPLPSITIEGIKSLLTGRFCDSIETFPFSGWTLKDVSEEEMKTLEKEFRSAHLL